MSALPSSSLLISGLPDNSTPPSLLAPGRVAEVWRDRLSLLLESTGEGVFGVDMDGLCTFINRAGAQMLGYHPESVIGLNMHDLMHHTHHDGRHYPVSECPIFNAFRAGVPCRIDSEVLWRRDGSSFAAEYSSYPILDGGLVHGAVVTFVDITERKRHQDQLRQAHDQLEKRVADRTQALSQALSQLRELQAHIEHVREQERTRIAREIHDELGSLLVGLKMDVSWLEKRLDDRPLRAKCLDMRRLMDTAVDNVGRIITDLRPSILDHQGLWATLEWQAQEFADSSELRCLWSLDIAPDLGEPDGPLATSVFRIFQELLSNVARHAQASQVEIRISATHSDITLVVKDNGRGAPPSAFDSTDAYGVMGMRERAGHFGGWLHIDSQLGQGTTVILTMPLYRARMIRVLLVDDHRIVRQGLRQVLADTADIEVVGEAADGVEAIRHVREHLAPGQGGLDVVMLDIAMPGRDGLDVLKQLKGDYPRLQVLMLSTYPDKQFAVRCLRGGAAGYLNKSADPDEMVAALRKAAAGGVYLTASVAEALASSLSEVHGKAAHDSLSKREHQVFRLLAEGQTVGQIAMALSLSPNTVSTYRARVLEKTGTRNDVELALYAVRQALVMA